LPITGDLYCSYRGIFVVIFLLTSVVLVV